MHNCIMTIILTYKFYYWELTMNSVISIGTTRSIKATIPILHNIPRFHFTLKVCFWMQFYIYGNNAIWNIFYIKNHWNIEDMKQALLFSTNRKYASTPAVCTAHLLHIE